MNRQRFWRFFLVALVMVITAPLTASGVSHGQSGEGEPGVLRNPLLAYGGADPWLEYYDGNYYLATTTWASEWTMRKSPTLAGLKTAEPVRIYFETDPSRCCNFWAPEFRLLEGPNGPRWYFYYSAGVWGTYDFQRSYVLESEGLDPMGPYTFKGRIFDPNNDAWSIDGSVLQLNGSLYFLFSAFQRGLQSLFIAPMSNPWTISGERVLLSQPEFPWEAQSGWVNEGPVALQHGDDTFIIYSASACSGPDYKLGMLRYLGGDPLNPDSWEKSTEPVFQRSDENGVFAPGHNGFFKSPDGTEDWIVYHANFTAEGACDGRRSTRVQKINWKEDGTPDFGVPVSTTEVIAAPSGDMGIDPLPDNVRPVYSRLKVYSYANAYLRHMNFMVRADSSIAPVADSEFLVVPGLADPEAVSFESRNFPGFYLRQQNNAIVLTPDDNSENYRADATWNILPGLADESWISLESYSQPGMVMGQRLGIIALVDRAQIDTDRERGDATFLIVQEDGAPTQ